MNGSQELPQNQNAALSASARSGRKRKRKKGLEITREDLSKILRYDPDTGDFIRLVHRNQNANVGAVAGYVHSKGYVHIGIYGRDYKAHRLAWLYMYGRWPNQQIDHINGVRSDNRLCNLREATNSQNRLNTPVCKSNTSGEKGVHWNKKCGKWVAQASVCAWGKRYLGLFNSFEEAVAVRKEIARKYHGEFFNDRKVVETLCEEITGAMGGE